MFYANWEKKGNWHLSYNINFFLQPFRKKKCPVADIKYCSIVFSYSLLCYSKVASDFIPLNWIKIVEIQKFVPKQDILLKFGGHFEKSAL